MTRRRGRRRKKLLDDPKDRRGYCQLKEEVLRSAKEERNIVHTIKRRKVNWIGHIWRGNCLLKQVIEGKVEGRMEVTGRRGRRRKRLLDDLNPLTPNDLYMSRTAPLTSKRCILYICSTNVGTEYFKHALYSPFFFSLFKMQFVS